VDEAAIKQFIQKGT